MNLVYWLFGTTAFVIAVIHLLLVSPASCFSQQPPSNYNTDSLFEEKTRLGSTPPSCHNKCNECHPCMAVQVPSIPTTHGGVRPLPTHILPTDFFDPSSAGNKYSNYKPLGWKCRCANHLYNP